MKQEKIRARPPRSMRRPRRPSHGVPAEATPKAGEAPLAASVADADRAGAAAVWAALYYWFASGGTVSTDNAAVKQDIVSVSAQVNGPVVEVSVKNGDR